MIAAEVCYWVTIAGCATTMSGVLTQLCGESPVEFFFGQMSVDNWASCLFATREW